MEMNVWYYVAFRKHHDMSFGDMFFMLPEIHEDRKKWVKL